MAQVSGEAPCTRYRTEKTEFGLGLTSGGGMSNTFGARTINKVIDFAFSGKKRAYPVLAVVLIVLLIVHLIRWARNPEAEYDEEAY